MTYTFGFIVCCICYIFHTFYLLFWVGLVKLLFTTFFSPTVTFFYLKALLQITFYFRGFFLSKIGNHDVNIYLCASPSLKPSEVT